MRGDRFRAAEGQERGNAEGEARAVPHLEAAGIDELRQALSAVFGRTGERVPAAGDPGLVGLLEARRRGDDAVAQLRAMAIAGAVDRRQHLAREARRFLQNILDHVEREVGIDAVADRAVELADVAHHEQHVVDGRAIGHCESSTWSPIASTREPARQGIPRPWRRSGQARSRAGAPFRNHFMRYVKCTLYIYIQLC